MSELHFKLQKNFIFISEVCNRDEMKAKIETPPEETSVCKTFLKAITRGSLWPDKDEFLDVIYWLRQVLGIIIGLVWGILPMQGFLGLALFFFVSSIIIYIYFQSFQGVDEDDFGGFSELVKEGCMTSFAGFLVTWIITYSGLHYG